MESTITALEAQIEELNSKLDFMRGEVISLVSTKPQELSIPVTSGLTSTA